jgi:aminoglycoside 2''-phosphotransferase
MVTGDPLMRHELLRLPEDVQDRIAEQLGTFLRQLHLIPQDVLQQAQIPLADSFRTVERWRQLYDDVQREAFPLMMKHTQAVVHALFAPIMNDSSWLDHTPCLTHGDLAQYHILYDAAAQQINGVIDFGVGGIGDPASDLGLLINVYGEGFLKRIGQFYPDLPQHLDRARFYAGTLELQWFLGGLRSKDFSWFTVHLDRARDISPYGLP